MSNIKKQKNNTQNDNWCCVVGEDFNINKILIYLNKMNIHKFITYEDHKMFKIKYTEPCGKQCKCQKHKSMHK
jgi:hypothetical protein